MTARPLTELVEEGWAAALEPVAQQVADMGEFLRADHPQSFLPDAVLQPRGSRKNPGTRTGSVAPAGAHTEPGSRVS